jgi:hypothetical protein
MELKEPHKDLNHLSLAACTILDLRRHIGIINIPVRV